jgi:hypothetical protein
MKQILSWSEVLTPTNLEVESEADGGEPGLEVRRRWSTSTLQAGKQVIKDNGPTFITSLKSNELLSRVKQRLR